GSAAGGIGEQDHAIECFRQALVGRANAATVYYNLGRSLAAQGRLDDAVISFRAALADALAVSDPDRLADIHASLGQALVGLGQYDEALASCEGLAALRPGAAQ